MEKHVIDSRVGVLKEEGIIFKVNAHVGDNVSVETLKADFDSYCSMWWCYRKTFYSYSWKPFERRLSGHGFLKIEQPIR